MPNAQFNPSNLKEAWDAATGKSMAVIMPCEDCPPETTPEKIKATLAGLLYCPGLGNCATNSGQTQHKVTSYGIGWNGETILEQGGLDVWSDPFRRDPSTCFGKASKGCCWTGFRYGNFGQIKKYTFENCTGDLLWTCNLTQLAVNVYKSNPMVASMEVWLGGWNDANPPQYIGQMIFLAHLEHEDPFENCLPYEEVFLDGIPQCPTGRGIGYGHNATGIITVV